VTQFGFPVKPFIYMTETVSVGSFRNMTERASAFPLC